MRQSLPGLAWRYGAIDNLKNETESAPAGWASLKPKN